MMRFIAPSGNTAELKIEARGGNAVVDMKWDKTASIEDVRAAEEFVKAALNPIEGVHSIYEEDAEKREAIAKRHLGAPLKAR